jgi:two-component system, LuxR family, response regulator FixJ
VFTEHTLAIPLWSEAAMNRHHVYLIDNDRARRARLVAMLDDERQRLWTFDSVPGFIQWLDYERLPESACVLTYLTLSPMNGVELLDVFRADGVSLPIVLIGSASELPLAIKAARYGGTYVLWWPFRAQLLNEVIDTMVTEWRTATPPDDAADASHAIEERFASLSRRQREVLRQVFAGNGNQTIARTLGISVKTVELHRACMMKKMRAESVVALIRMMSSYRAALGSHS